MLKYKQLILCLLIFIYGAVIPAKAQLPCSAITRNPQMLEGLMDEQRAIEAREQMEAQSVVEAVELSSLKFAPIAIRPGDALYVEYMGKNFTINAEYSGGDNTAFDVPAQASEEQWRKGVLLLDHILGLNQQLVHLSVIAYGEKQPRFRNVRFIHAGEPIFKFTKLDDGETPHLRMAVDRHIELNCIPDSNPNLLPMNTSTSMNPYAPKMSNRMPTMYGDVMQMQPQATLPMMVAAYQSGGTPSGGNHYKFTGKERDDETGLDNYGARYYSSNMGRFMSPDWSERPTPVPYANLYDPQTLNLYSYVRNNPVNKTDPEGHCPQCLGALFGGAVGAAQILYQTGKAVITGKGAIPTNQQIAGAIIGGALTGALATPGGGMLTQVISKGGVMVAAPTITTVVVQGGTAAAVGGMIGRGIATGDGNQATDIKKVGTDYVLGAATAGGSQQLVNSSQLARDAQYLGDQSATATPIRPESSNNMAVGDTYQSMSGQLQNKGDVTNAVVGTGTAVVQTATEKPETKKDPK